VSGLTPFLTLIFLRELFKNICYRLHIQTQWTKQQLVNLLNYTKSTCLLHELAGASFASCICKFELL